LLAHDLQILLKSRIQRWSMVLDIAGAMKRLGNDESLFLEFIGFYEEDYPRLLKNLENAAKAHDGDGVHHAAHGLMGLVASLGAIDVAAAAVNLEKIGRSGDFSEVDTALAKLQAEVGQLNTELAAFRKQTTK
jgi:HPt (histidine-containing phosphotransfer) domain-containing protein